MATDPDGVSTTNAYNSSPGSNGFLTDLASAADGLGKVTTIGYDRVGNQTSVTTPKSELTSTSYDLLNHITSSTGPDLVVSAAGYDDYGFKLADIANRIDGNSSGPSGLDDLATVYTYDALGNVTKVETDCGQTTPTISCTANGGLDGTTTTSYDLLGNAIGTTRYPGPAGTGAPSTTTAYVETKSINGLVYSRATPTATRGPMVPPSGAPACLDATQTVVCTSSAVMAGALGASVSGVDPGGLTTGLTGPYGAVSRTFHDLDGRPVFVVANYVDGIFDPSVADADLLTATQYHISGQAEVTIGVRRYATDTTDPRTVTGFDQLGRAVATTSFDTSGAATNVVKTVFTPGGRVDRVSRPDGTGVADASRSWTKTVYDRAGRAIKTLDHFDVSGGAGLAVDTFEGPSLADPTIANDGIAERWDAGAGLFIASGSTATENNAAPTAKTGASVLAVTTAPGANTGVEWKLDGRFVQGRPYKATIWANVPSGTNITIKIGVSGDQASQSLNGNGAWQQAAIVNWTPTADRTGVVLAVYRSASGSPVTLSLDDAVVWDSTAQDLDVPTSETIYDDNGAVVATIAPPGSAGTTEPMVTRTTRDVRGRVTAISANEVAGASGDQTSNLLSQTHYDALSRTDFTLDPLNHKTSFAFDRLAHRTATVQNDTGVAPTFVTDDHGIKSSFAYDVLGQLTGYCPAQQVFLGGCDPTSTTNAQAWHWTFDAAGDRTAQVPPVNQTLSELATTHWTYDGGGRLVSIRDDHASGTVVDRQIETPASAYDAVGRLLMSKTYVGAPSGTPALQTTTTYLASGQVSSVAYAENGTTLDAIVETYDAAGRPNLVQRVASPSNITLAAFGWNADDSLATRADGDAGAVGTTTFSYDWAKRLASALLPGGWQTGANSATFTYRADGLIGGRTWNGGTVAAFSYDAAKRVTGLTLSSLATFGQTYDRVGNVKSESRTLSLISGDPGTGTQSFAYDGVNRVTAQTGLSADSSLTPQFTYDQDSNRLQKIDGAATFTYHYDRTDELKDVTKSGGTLQPAAYSNLGDLTSDPESGSSSTAYAYDIGGKLASITPAGGPATTFTYDALGGPRTRAVPGGGTDTYSYVGSSKSVVRISNSGGTTTDSITDSVGDRLGVKQGATVNWAMPDLHGSIAAGIDQALSQVRSGTRYDAYGQVLATGGPGGPGASTWKYQGRLDLSPGGTNSTTLYAAEARLYAPGLGQFSQLDSMVGSAQNPSSMNRFLYAEANPATLIDPTGHIALEGDGAWTRSVATTPWSQAHPSRRIRDTNDSVPSGRARPTALRMDVPGSRNGPGWFAVGALEGVVSVGVSALTTTAYAVTHLSDAAAGIQCFKLDGCLADAVHETGFDRPLDNLLAGAQYLHHQPDEYKGQFAGSVVAAALMSRGLGRLAELSSATAADVAENAGVVFRSDTAHIFVDKVGHLASDTAENRALIQGTVNPRNLRSTIVLRDGSTLAKYFETLPDGTQAWAEVRDGTEITNGGLNVIPR